MVNPVNTIPVKLSLLSCRFHSRSRSIRPSICLTSRLSTQLCRRTIVSAAGGHEELFNFTSGRWLWDEERWKRKFYKPFNVAELQRAAARAAGTEECVSIQKLSEHVAREYRLTMSDGTSVIARVRYEEDSSIPQIVSSEAAVMAFASEYLDIPTPQVLAYNDDNDGPVGCKYLIHAEPRGRPLSEVIGGMTLAERLNIVDELVLIQKKLTSSFFSQYGSLYFANDAPQISRPAEVVGDVTSVQQSEVQARFAIGPAATSEFWHKRRALAQIDRGPWSNPFDYIQAVCNREREYIAKYAIVETHQTDAVSIECAKDQHNRDRHIELLEKMKAVCQHVLPQEARLSRATLWHHELWTDVIHVEGSKISDITEWSGVWAGPLFLQASKPGSVIHRKLSWSENEQVYHSLPPSERQEMVEQSARQSLADLAYQVKTKSINAVLQRVYETPHWQHRKHLAQFAQDSWDEDIIKFKESLLKVIRRWDDINPDIPCPISFTDDEIRSHREETEGFNEVADLWDSLYPVINRDGFVSNANYEPARELFAALREEYLSDPSNSDLEDFEKATRWVLESKSK